MSCFSSRVRGAVLNSISQHFAKAELGLERCLRSSMWESPGTAEVWRLPMIDHGTVIGPVLSRSGYLARIQPVPLFPKRVNFWHMHCSEKKSPLS